MNKIKILLIEDEQTLAMIIKDTLSDEGFDIVWAGDGEKGLELYLTDQPDLLIADVMMPRLNGFEMISKIRQTDKITPVLFLTARSAIKDIVEGFERGANDYLKKPFNMQELIIRIKSLVNRAFIEKEKTESNHFEISDYTFDAVAQKLYHAGNILELSHRESEILKRLCLHKNEVVSTRNILIDFWGDDSFFNVRSLHVFITKLRHKLSQDKRIRVINVRGIGYKLIF